VRNAAVKAIRIFLLNKRYSFNRFLFNSINSPICSKDPPNPTELVIFNNRLECILSGCLYFRNLLAFDTNFFMMFLNILFGWRFEQTEAFVSLGVVEYI
jgi:hypothetical protein